MGGRGRRGLTALWHTLSGWADDLDRVIFPRECVGCGRTLVGGEKYLCLECDVRMPRTNFHLSSDNPLHQRLLGSLTALPSGVSPLRIERAGAYFYYQRESPYAELIKSAKYHNRPEIDRHFARRFANEALASGFFEGVDLLIPVPMHWRKQARRGYNQAEEVALGLADVTGIEVAHNLYARRGHSTQTRKSAEQRLGNIEGGKTGEGIFAVDRPEALRGRHIMVVDDVVTTGSTLHACCMALHLAVPSARLSVFALGTAKW